MIPRWHSTLAPILSMDASAKIYLTMAAAGISVVRYYRYGNPLAVDH
jgi:hypothetical protein